MTDKKEAMKAHVVQKKCDSVKETSVKESAFSRGTSTKTTETIEYGSQNVFADLGLENADELFTRAQLGMQVFSIIKERGYKQIDAANILGITQSEISALGSGKFNRFSQERLISFLNKLDWKVKMGKSRDTCKIVQDRP
jgi:predicted XRE-type DNA-binding protein